MTAAPDAPAQIYAGVPAVNKAFFHRLRFTVVDPAVLIEFPSPAGQAVLILRDIEMDRARSHARADAVFCPRDFTPAAGLSGDRETATAQAAAECLGRAGVSRVVADRTLPLIYASVLASAGITVVCDRERGLLQRRAKDDAEAAALQVAQQMTERAVELACRTIARAACGVDGTLLHDDQPLTSERVRGIIDVFLMQNGFANPVSIIAAGPIGADCHHYGTGPLRTGEPVIVDIFPHSRASHYNGDCTRTVVHGRIPPVVRQMHQIVVEAKRAAVAATRAGVTGEAVHRATADVMLRHGCVMGFPAQDAPSDTLHMPHGTGHGIGLDVHEPPLLDIAGPTLIPGDALTIEPALYARSVGGVRVEDMVIVTPDGCRNLNTLHEGLDWT